MNGKCGYSVRSALEKRYAGLDGRDDHMFVGFRLAVTIRFEVRGEPYSRYFGSSVILGIDLGFYRGSGRLMKSGPTRSVIWLPLIR